MAENKSKNVGICYSYRLGVVSLKCFQVENDTKNKGELFKCCTLKCGYFDWIKAAESSGVVGQDETEDLSAMFQNLARIYAKEEVEISVTVSIRKGNASAECNTKGKEPA